jgi:PKD repeat protein
MGHRREFRFFLFVALCLFCVDLLGQSTPTPTPVVWFVDHDALKAIAQETNSLAHGIDLTTRPDALAVDRASGDVWLLLERRLVRLSAQGVEIVNIDVSRLRPNIDHPEFLTTSPYDGSPWVAGGGEVMKFSNDGRRLAYWRAPRKINGITLDVDDSLWVLADRQIHHLSAEGAPLNSLNLETRLLGTERLAIDGLGGILWIADVRRLLRFNLGQVASPPGEFALPNVSDDEPETADGTDQQTLYLARALAVHPVFGTLWVATFRHLRLFDRAGNHLKTVKLPKEIGIANSMAFDSRGLSLWIGGSKGLARFSGNGDFIATVPFVDHEANQVAVAGFTLLPDVSVSEPVDGTLTNNPRPRIRLSLGATCSGVPCLLPDSYTTSLHLDAMLNGQSVGHMFQIAGTEAIFDPPTQLSEGTNTLVARGVDLFGHASGEATSRFIVDTIAPKFISISPADGSTQSNAATVVSGEVDDPSVNVLLVDDGGQAISTTSGASFSFSVVLKAGINAFSLTARDPAGNETTVPLRLVFNPVSVKITSPTTGATVSGGGVVVSGNLVGPANTGITVNGVVAQVVGTQFYANLSLLPGSNTLTVVATTPSGIQVTDSVSVVADSPASVEIVIEPQSGIAPLTVRIIASSNTERSIAEVRLDANGDGTSDVVKNKPVDPLEYVYSTPGVYQPKITVTDSAGAASEHTLAIVVYDGQHMDQLFTALWDGMNSALAQGDSATPVSFLNDTARLKYQPVFEALKTHFPEIIASYSSLNRVSISSDIGEYAVVRPNNGRNQLYLIYFLRDVDGVWRVDAM